MMNGYAKSNVCAAIYNSEYWFHDLRMKRCDFMFLFLLCCSNIKLIIKIITQFNVIPVFNVTSHQEATRDS